MFLDRIDIDQHGPLTRLEAGPFSEHLNAVCGPEGSGKTAIARFVRDSLIQRNYPLGMMSSSSGRVVWADRNGKIHCRREQDGTDSGRRTIEFESRGDSSHRFDWLQGTWVEGIADSTDADRALNSIRIPESIVDGIVTDTAVTSVSRVLKACIESGLTDRGLFDRLPLNASVVSGTSPVNPQDDEQRRLLRDELARIEAEIAGSESGIRASVDSGDSVAMRRRRLESRLDYLRSLPGSSRSHGAAESELASLHDTIWRLRVRQSELARWMDHLRADHRGRATAAPSVSTGLPHMSAVDSRLREQLQEIDHEILRWRRILAEMRSLRDVLLTDSHRLTSDYLSTLGSLPWSDQVLRRERWNHFLNSLDGFSPPTEAQHRAYADWRSAAAKLTSAWPDEIDLRLEAIIRQVDSLVGMYDGTRRGNDWYATLPSHATYRSEGSLVRSLQLIRQDLEEVRRHGFRFGQRSDSGPVGAEELKDLHAMERWIVGSINRLLSHRDTVAGDLAGTDALRYPSWLEDSSRGQTWSAWYVDHLNAESHRCRRELDSITSELDRHLTRAAQLRYQIRGIQPAAQAEIDSIVAELATLDRESYSGRDAWLVARRAQLIEQLGIANRSAPVAMPLAREASQWLVRLSGGRLRNLEWSEADLLIRIDHREESQVPAADRGLAALALRMASADLCARTGRQIPLVVETHRELLETNAGDRMAFVAALDDYCKLGRQVVLLTSDLALAEQVQRRGGYVCRVRSQRVAHEGRPLWRPHFAHEQYLGNYPELDRPRHLDPTYYAAPMVGEYYDTATGHYGTAAGVPAEASVAEMNRTLDAIWHDTYNVTPSYRTAPVAPPAAGPAQPDWHDGYYYADTYTTSQTVKATSANQAPTGQEVSAAPTKETKRSTPFFLTVDSPIDQAPSVDAVAASRLRALNVTHVNHLMQQDPNRLSDALGLGGVTAATIRRWQAECRLVCHVPQLRGFDARVLVGCGINDAAKLAATDPNDLLDRVEAFLATERGQRILLSGTSYELSRITSWIASANVSTDDNPILRMSDHKTVDGRVLRDASGSQGDDYDRERYDYEFVGDDGQVVRARSRRRSRRAAMTTQTSDESRSRRSGSRQSTKRRSRRPAGELARSSRRSRGERQRATREYAAAEETNATEEFELRFYLQRESPVVDAPSIGARMAEKLEALEIYTVNDLLESDADEVAEQLDHRRVDADVVRAWQQQSILVCRIPMLRGHDAQLLVAAEVTTAEEVAEYDAESLFELIDPIARSNEGKRILRGSKLPDLAEISDWITYAAQNRELKAA